MEKDKKDKKLNARLTTKEMEKLEQLTKKYKMTKSEIIRKLIRETN